MKESPLILPLRYFTPVSEGEASSPSSEISNANSPSGGGDLLGEEEGGGGVLVSVSLLTERTIWREKGIQCSESLPISEELSEEKDGKRRARPKTTTKGKR